MLEDYVCSHIAFIGASAVTEFNIGLPTLSRYELPRPLRLPDCFWSMTSVKSVTLQGVFVIGSTGKHADPLVRLPSSVVHLSIYDSRIINPTVGGATYKPNWSAIFSSKPRMEDLTLDDVQLESTIPSPLPAILTGFRLSNNSLLTGTIPSTLLANFPKSQTDIAMDFSFGSLNGTIPGDLFSNAHKEITSITFKARGNQLTGIYPNLIRTSSWPNCHRFYVDFASNKLHGDIPPAILPVNGRYVDLALVLSDNALSGSIPSALFADSWATFHFLQVDCSQNKLTGTIPSFFAAVEQELQAVNVGLLFGSSQLSGEIPKAEIWPVVTMQTSLFSLDLSSNLITGSVPDDMLWYAATSLTDIGLNFAHNQLTGTIGSTLIYKTDFDQKIKLRLNFANNGISGPIETALVAAAVGTCTDLKLDLSSNPLGGTIPSDLLAAFVTPYSPFSYLMLSFNNCSLSGTLPDLANGIDGLEFSANENQLNAAPAPWSDFLYKAMQNLVEFQLNIANNRFTGEFALPSFTTSRDALYATFNLYGNDITTLHIGNETRYLYALNIGMNGRLTGSLPSAWFDATSSVASLIANYTSLTGSFPDMSGIVNSKLKVLDLSNTAINFCPMWKSAWETIKLDYCNLGNTNAIYCISYFPSLCKKSL